MTLDYKYFIFILLFLPSVTFGLGSSEIFPWSFLVTLIYINYIFPKFIFFIYLFLPGIILGLYEGASYIRTIQSLFGYFNAILIFFVVLKINEYDFIKLKKALVFSTFLIFTITFLQYTIPSNFLENLVNIFVPRAITIYGSGMQDIQATGVSGLSSEPSRQGVEVVILFSTIIGLQLIKTKFYIALVHIIFIFLLLFVNKSATASFFLLMFFVSILLHYRYLKSSIFMFFVSMMIYFLFENLYVFSRGLAILYEIGSLDDLSIIANFVLSSGGSRFQGTFASYLNPTFLGFGVGNWEVGSLTGLLKNPYLYEGSNDFQKGLWGPRPTSFFSSVLMEMGLIVFFILIIYFAIEIIKIINEGVKEIKLEYLLPPVVSIFLLGDIGNPIPFIAIAILLREKFRIEKKTLY